MIWAIGASAVIGAAMPWRRRIWEWMETLPERLGESRLPVQVGSIAASAIMAMSLSYVVLGGHVGTSGGGGGAVLPAAPDMPQVYTITSDTNSVIIVGSAFSGDGSDQHDSTQVQVFRVATALSGTAMLSASSGAQIRDTLTSNDSLKADTIYKARIRYKGKPDQSNAWSEWSAPDTFTNQALFFQMDLGAGAYPLAGFSALQDTVANCTTIARSAGAGPSGQAIYRLATTDSAYNNDVGCPGQPYVGWAVTLAANAAFGYGGTFYERFRFRLPEGTNCNAWDFTGGDIDSPVSSTIHSAKTTMHNDQAPGGNSEGRVMFAVACHQSESPNRVGYYLARANGDQRCNSNGLMGSGSFTLTHDDGVWVDVQIRRSFSSAEDADDASYALWLDNNTEGSPTCVVNTTTWTASTVVINTDGQPRTMHVGFYWNNPQRAPDGDIVYEITDYEIGPTFHPGWNN